MSRDTIALPLPNGPCPSADDPEAILLWLYWQHLAAGRIEKYYEHLDPFWRLIEEKRQDQVRMEQKLAADPLWATWVTEYAARFKLDLRGMGKEAQIETVVQACVPMRFQISGALEELGELERAVEVLDTVY